MVEQPIVGGYKVTWRSGYLGGLDRVYVGCIAADDILAGKYTVVDAIRTVIAEQVAKVAVERVCLLEVKAGRKVVVKETFDNAKHGYQNKTAKKLVRETS
jgi:hypothetical protein